MQHLKKAYMPIVVSYMIKIVWMWDCLVLIQCSWVIASLFRILKLYIHRMYNFPFPSNHLFFISFSLSPLRFLCSLLWNHFSLNPTLISWNWKHQKLDVAKTPEITVSANRARTMRTHTRVWNPSRVIIAWILWWNSSKEEKTASMSKVHKQKWVDIKKKFGPVCHIVK